MSFGPRTFRCPSCNEMINESVRQCGYCSVAVDPGVAQLIADKQQKANQACSAASYLRTATICDVRLHGPQSDPISAACFAGLCDYLCRRSRAVD